MLTKSAIGNLVNRYRAVLTKCHLINAFGSLAVASMFVLGSAGMAAGGTSINLSNITNNKTYSPVTPKSDTTGYEVTITGGTYNRIFGVNPTGNYTAKENTLFVQGGTYDGPPPIAGAACVKRLIDEKTKTIYLENNKIIVKNFIADSEYGLDAYGALGQGASASHNTVELIMSEGEIASAIGATINNGGKAEHNKVIYKGGGSAQYLLGARLNYDSNIEDYIAQNNEVTMNSGTVTEHIAGAESRGRSSANLNIVEIKGGTAERIYGGYSYYGSADENSIDISGDARVKRHIAGGMGGTSAIKNKITISGEPKLNNVEIYGGAFFEDHNKPATSNPASPTSDFRTGNTLNIKTSGLTAKNIYNFDTINFTVASKVRPGDKPLLELKGGGETDLTDVAVGVTVEPRTDVLKKGDRIHLLKNDSNLVGEAKGEVDSIPYGNFVTYDFALDQTQTTLDLEVVNASTTPQAKSLSEGRTAMLAFVNQGAELIAERGMEAARQEALEGSLTPFLAGQGGKSRYDTGSHVDVTGFSLIAGLTSAKKTEIGTATMAAFFESGWADYDAHNSFASAASVNADGNTRYYGGGLLAHMAFPDFGPGHAYAETSLRTGWAETDYHSGDLRDSFGNTAAYDSGSAYYGAHFGLGYEWKLSDVSALDFYAKYFWTHQEGDHVRVMSDPIHFESADSHRSRFGVRYEHEFKTDGMVVKPFIGAAYEYEYDGDVAGTAYGFAMDKPSLRGGTGAGELGVTLKSSENSAFSLNLSVQGYTGTREGVSGSFLLNYRF